MSCEPALSVLARLPPAYFEYATKDEQLEHARLFQKLKASDATASLYAGSTLGMRGADGVAMLKLHFVFYDVPGALMSCTQLLSERGAGMLEATVFATSDGVAVCTFLMGSHHPEGFVKLASSVSKELKSHHWLNRPQVQPSGGHRNPSATHRGGTRVPSCPPSILNPMLHALLIAEASLLRLHARLPPSYRKLVAAMDQMEHARMLDQLEDEKRDVVLSWTSCSPEYSRWIDERERMHPVVKRTGTPSRFHFVFRDVTGALHLISGVLTRAGVNMLDCVAFHTYDGFAICSFLVEKISQAPTAEEEETSQHNTKRFCRAMMHHVEKETSGRNGNYFADCGPTDLTPAPSCPQPTGLVPGPWHPPQLQSQYLSSCCGIAPEAQGQAQPFQAPLPFPPSLYDANSIADLHNPFSKAFASGLIKKLDCSGTASPSTSMSSLQDYEERHVQDHTQEYSVVPSQTGPVHSFLNEELLSPELVYCGLTSDLEMLFS